MNTRERLEWELDLCRRDVQAAYDRAPLAAARFIRRRLNQLDGRFHRHGWGWTMPNSYNGGLRVIPAVWGEHDGHTVAVMGLQALWSRRELYERLKSIAGELDMTGRRIQTEFGRQVPDVLSNRAAGWGVHLGSLNPDAIANRRSVQVVASGFGSVDKPRVWPMHRRGGCGYL